MKRSLIVLFLLGMFVGTSQAQKSFENWAVGANAGLYGAGAQLATSLSPNLVLRVGYDYLPVKYTKAIEFTAPIVNISGSHPDMEGELSELKLKFPNAKVMFDFYPVKKGIFSVTLGLFVGNNTIKTKGLIDDYAALTAALGENPHFEFEETTIKPNADGSFEATLNMGKTFKPYVGIGLGRTIASKRVGFRFELGMVYQGEYTVDSPNLVLGSSFKDKAADFDLPVSKSLLDWWPMLNFALSFRVK